MNRPTDCPSQKIARSNERGFTLVELLVVIAIIAILAGMVTTGIQRARRKASQIECLNNLKNIGTAAMQYSEEYRGRYPWPKRSGTAELTDESDAREALGLLYRYGFVDVPVVFVCPSDQLSDPAEKIEDKRERRETFHLDEGFCSYTWRNKLITANSQSDRPMSGDMRGGDNAEYAHHPDGRNILLKDGSVKFWKNEELEGDGGDASRLRRELVGFSTID
ncbi:MAG: type II secretion system protein [Planctomycetota bacterium]|jgi:prepilin-type N-terminal cleavage/methylation domain-containing protein